MNNDTSRRMFLALGLAASFAIAACHSKATTAAVAPSLPIPLEFGEVDASAPVRHLFDKAGKPVDMGISSSITVHASIDSVTESSDGPAQLGRHSMAFTILGADGKTFEDWTAKRIGKPMAVIVDDQVLNQSAVMDKLPPSGILRLPDTIRSQALKDALAKAPKR